MPQQLEPSQLISRYRFVLGAFGLDAVRTALYSPNGEPQKQDRFEKKDYNSRADRGTPNMHNNYSVGDLLRPGSPGSPPKSKFETPTPVWSDVILHKQHQQVPDGVQLINCLASVSQSKNIVKTVVQGRNGTVKEYISDGDYIVTLRGAIVRMNRQEYPLEEMARFIDQLRYSYALKVLSPFLLQFKIYDLVVEDYTLSQQEGRVNMQTFDIRCSSDEPLLLKAE